MGEPVAGIDTRIGFVFQTDALFPWLSVLRNIAAGPLYRGKSKVAAYAEAREWIARVGLVGFENHYPHQLSGRMRKRVTLAQTFINSPEILLMDEPFSALDVQTRVVMQDELLKIWSSSRASVVFVTHDLEEAIALADRVYVLTAGRNRQGGLRHRAAAAARHVGNSLRARIHRALAPDMERSARRSSDQLRSHTARHRIG